MPCARSISRTGDHSSAIWSLLEIGILPFIFGGVLLLFGIESGFY